MNKRYHWLAHLIKKKGWRIGAELGLRNGETYLYLLGNCPNLHLIGVDCWAGGLGHAEVERAERLVRSGAAQYGNRATIIKDWTVPAAAQVDDASLDFIFVDADHSSESVRADLVAWMPKVKSGGWVTGHDIDWPTVRVVVDEVLPGFVMGPDNCYGRRV